MHSSRRAKSDSKTVVGFKTGIPQRNDDPVDNGVLLGPRPTAVRETRPESEPGMVWNGVRGSVLRPCRRYGKDEEGEKDEAVHVSNMVKGRLTVDSIAGSAPPQAAAETEQQFSF